jgi:hypothetical protein
MLSFFRRSSAARKLVVGFQILSLVIATAVITVPLSTVFAQSDVPCPPGTQSGPGGVCVPTGGGQTNINRVSDFIIFIINILLALAGLVAVLFLIIGGFQYIASRGNEEATEAAKKTIFNAIIGVVVIILAFVIVRIISNALTNRQI